MDNPFEFGIVQKVRRLFVKKVPAEAILLARIDQAFDNALTVNSAFASVINQWGPITFAEETIESNKKMKIQIMRENGFVKFRLGGSNDQRENSTATGVQRFSGDAGEHGDGAPESRGETVEESASPRDPGRVWYDHPYTESYLPRYRDVHRQDQHNAASSGSDQCGTTDCGGGIATAD